MTKYIESAKITNLRETVAEMNALTAELAEALKTAQIRAHNRDHSGDWLKCQEPACKELREFLYSKGML